MRVLSKVAMFAVLAISMVSAGRPVPSSRTLSRRNYKQTDSTTTLSALTTPSRGGTAAKSDNTLVSIPSPQTGLNWALLLALNAGFVNGCCLAGYVASKKQAVAAVTGAWTNSAIGVANAVLGNKAGLTVFKEQTSVLLSYICGSGIYGMLNPAPTAWKLVRSTAGWAMLLVAGFLLAASSTAENPDGPLLTFCLAAIACGIQNSFTSSHSGNLLRTTHYSGMSSDMGTFGGQLLRGNTQNAFKFQAFVSLGAAFWIGGFAAVYFGQSMDGSTKLALGAIVPTLVGLGILFAAPSDTVTAKK